METYGKSLFFEDYSEIRSELLNKLKNKIYLTTEKINSLQEGVTINFLSEEKNKFKEGSEIYIIEQETNYIKGKVIYEGSFLLNEDTNLNEYKLKVFSLTRNSEDNENLLQEGLLTSLKDFFYDLLFAKLHNFSISEYKKEAEKYLDEKYIYITIYFNFGTFGNLLKKVANDPFSHASISLDSNLNSLISFNMVHENTSGLVWEDPVTEYNSRTIFEIYKLKATKEQKQKILDFITDIATKGTKYDYMQILKNLFSFSVLTIDDFKKLNDKNLSICSSFVISCLVESGLADGLFYNNEIGKGRPYDIIKYSNKNKLKLVYTGNLYEYVNKSINFMDKSDTSSTELFTFIKDKNKYLKQLITS